MDVLWLKTLREVARLGSITAAARSLGYTQSGVSRQIAALETATGARLLDRQARGVELTEHGRRLLPHADAIVDRLQAAERDLETLDRLDGGPLRVGAFPTANAALVPRALAQFATEYPNVSLSLVEGTTRRQLANLDLGDVDVAVISAFPGHALDADRYELTHLLDDSLSIALPRAHRLAGRRSVRLAELSGESWIGGDTANSDSRTLSPLRLQSHDEARIDFMVGEWTAKLGLVAAGLGITLVPSLAAAATRADVAIVPLRRGDQTARRVYAATAKHRTRPPATKAFLAVLVSCAQVFAKTGTV